MVMYQPGWGDMFIHRYSYDAENRLTLVETSTDSLVWEREARYEYYRHGPLARMVLGEQLVQGLDYAYTLQGWLKGVNSTGATSLYDMGGDGRNTGVDTLNRYTGRDVYSYTLNYFDEEYKPINTGVNPFPSSAVTFGSTDFRPLYNGNISSMASNIRQFSDPNMQGGPILLYNYTYDQLNRLKAMDVYNSYNSGTNSWSASSKLAAFAERIAYDGNGNILKYFRNGTAEGAFPGYDATIDSLSYKYYTNTNRLQRVTDNIRTDKLGSNSWDFNYDIDNQTDASNYKYDSIGNLISDVAEKIDTIKWSVYGKILEIKKTDPVTNHVINILYKYDAMGNRIGKVVSKYGTSTRDFTWYVRDAQGNIMATYNTSGTATDVNLQTLALGTSEKYIYGSSRLGMDRWYVTTDSGQLYDMRWYNSNTFRRGWKNYELSNHLGNVLATISDKKKGVPLANSSLIDYFEADVQTAQDYYPFGMLMPHRSYASTANYRFGFNGKENDNEPKGLGNQQDYGERIYDLRLGRFLSVDPLTQSYPWYTPYQFAGNSPICNVDLDGEEEKWFKLSLDEKTGKAQLTLVRETKEQSILWGLISWENDHVATHVEYKGQTYSFNIGGNDPGAPYISKVYNEFVSNPEATLATYPNILTSDEQEFEEMAVQGGAVALFGAIGTYKSISNNKSVTTPKSQQNTEESVPNTSSATSAGQQQAATKPTSASNVEVQPQVNKGAVDPTKNRVKLRKDVVKEIKARQPKNDQGQMIDPNTKKPLKPGKTDIGHKSGEEWRYRKKMHQQKGSTRKQVIEEENNPNLYHLEDRESNRSHRHEQKS